METVKSVPENVVNNSSIPQCFFKKWSSEEKAHCRKELRDFYIYMDTSNYTFPNIIYNDIIEAKIELEDGNYPTLLDRGLDRSLINQLRRFKELDAIYPNTSYPAHSIESLKTQKALCMDLLAQIQKGFPDLYKTIINIENNPFPEIVDYRTEPEKRTILTIGCGHTATECPTHSGSKMKEKEILVSLNDAEKNREGLGFYGNDIKADAADPKFWELFKNGTFTEINAYEMIPPDYFLNPKVLKAIFQKLKDSGVFYLAGELKTFGFYMNEDDVIELLKKAGFRRVEKIKDYIKPSYKEVGETRGWDVFAVYK
jgi:hypothetical protein